MKISVTVQNGGEAVSAVGWLSEQHQHFFRRTENWQWLFWCHSCLWGSRLWSSQVDSLSKQPFFQSAAQKSKQTASPDDLYEGEAKDLQALVNFIYLGEAHILQANLESFLAIAEELQLKGLSSLSAEQVFAAQQPIWIQHLINICQLTGNQNCKTHKKLTVILI